MGPGLYTYAAGVADGFNRMSGMESPQCRYTLDSYVPNHGGWSIMFLNQVYCKGELDGLYLQLAWGFFVREQLSVRLS